MKIHADKLWPTAAFIILLLGFMAAAATLKALPQHARHYAALQADLQAVAELQNSIDTVEAVRTMLAQDPPGDVVALFPDKADRELRRIEQRELPKAWTLSRYDMLLPDLSGEEASACLKTFARHPEMAIKSMTVSSSGEDKIRLGVEWVLLSPPETSL